MEDIFNLFFKVYIFYKQNAKRTAVLSPDTEGWNMGKYYIQLYRKLLFTEVNVVIYICIFTHEFRNAVWCYFFMPVFIFVVLLGFFIYVFLNK